MRQNDTMMVSIQSTVTEGYPKKKGRLQTKMVFYRWISVVQLFRPNANNQEQHLPAFFQDKQQKSSPTVVEDWCTRQGDVHAQECGHQQRKEWC